MQGLSQNQRVASEGAEDAAPPKRRRLLGKQSPCHPRPGEQESSQGVSGSQHCKLLSLSGQELGSLTVDPAASGRHLVAAARRALRHPHNILQLVSGTTVISEDTVVQQQHTGGALTCILRPVTKIQELHAASAVTSLRPDAMEHWQAWDCIQHLELMEIKWDLTELPLPGNLIGLTFFRKFKRGNVGWEDVVFPSRLQRLSMSCNLSLQGLTLPSGLQSLNFMEAFNRSLVGLILPSGLQSLSFGKNFNQSMRGVELPSRLQSLEFGSAFNQSVAEVDLKLPSGLQSLTFFSNISLLGIQLPSGLKSLKLVYQFNGSLRGVELPSRLQSLEFGDAFNQSLAGPGISLPSSLQNLSLSGKFNQSLVEVALPSSLKTLVIPYYYDQSLAGVKFPSGLQRLRLHPPEPKLEQILAGAELPSATVLEGGFGKAMNITITRSTSMSTPTSAPTSAPTREP